MRLPACIQIIVWIHMVVIASPQGDEAKKVVHKISSPVMGALSSGHLQVHKLPSREFGILRIARQFILCILSRIHYVGNL